jgi:alpha/beta superfamily hydrolase
MDFLKLVFESKDVKAFRKDIQDIIKSDSKARQLQQSYRKDEDKIVDFIDHFFSKHADKLDEIMKEYNINYDEAVDIIAKEK